MSSKHSAKSLRIKEFRGSTQDFSISFDQKKTISLIYGENGSGKTTICDAFDFVGNGKVGSLEYRGLGVLHPFWATIGKSNADILVELTVDGSTWCASASAKAVTITPANGAPKIEVLRRSTILKLVQDAPKDKYDAIKPFIDISAVEQAEASLRKLIKDTRQSETDASNRIAENRESIERQWQQSGSRGKNALVWAKAEVATPPLDHSLDVKALRDAVRAIEAVAAQKDDALNTASSHQEAEEKLEQANEILARTEEGAISADADFLQILRSARDHFASHPVGDSCPLCESAEKIDGLVDRVNDRLEKLKELEVAKNSAQSAVILVDTKIAVVKNSESKIKQLASIAVEKIDQAIQGWKEKIKPLFEQLSKVVDTGSLVGFEISILNSAIDSANEFCSEYERRSNSYKTIKSLYDQYESNYTRQVDVSRILPKLDQALVVIEAQRKKFLDGILVGIAQEVGRLYENIHPGEGLNQISLKLDPKKTGSLDLGAKFLSEPNKPPHAYFSESHLDSLGLCIFLALAGRSSPSDTIIVMDDVLGSIDEPHVDRLIEMLYAESMRFKHTVITTHYLPWREKFRWGWLRTGECELMELGEWNPLKGIHTATLAHSPLFELQNHLNQNPLSMQSACASAGVLLEAICEYIARRYECSVPLRKGKLTLNDLLPNISSKLKAALRVEIKQADGSYQSVELGEKLSQLQQIMQIRNVVGCHFNDLSQQLPPQDAKAFASTVLEVGLALICADEGWPGSDKSGSYWATKNETRRLHPLKKPS